MSKQLLALAASAALALSANAATLATGDIAFTAFNADEDGLAFVTLVNIDPGTTIYFTDNEWTGSAFNSSESYNEWQSGANTIAAGTVVRFSAYDKTSLSASFGTLSRVSVSGNTNWGISNSGETIYPFLGSNATNPTTLLAAITNGTFTSHGPLTGTGLTEGTSNAIRLTAKAGASSEPDFAQYTGSRGTFASAAAARAALGDLNNWTIDTVANSVSAGVVPDTTAFTISAVPEPQTYAMLLAGLAAVGFVARRRR